MHNLLTENTNVSQLLLYNVMLWVNMCRLLPRSQAITLAYKVKADNATFVIIIRMKTLHHRCGVGLCKRTTTGEPHSLPSHHVMSV